MSTQSNMTLRWLSGLNKASTHKRWYNIPVINYIIMAFFSFLLIRLTWHYHRLYTKSSLMATIATNLVLFGIADTMAQSIAAFYSPLTRRRNSSVASALERGHVLPEEPVVDNIEMFVDYGDENYQDGDTPKPTVFHPAVDSAAFDFKRFWYFMFWGFLMAFVSIGWYTILNSLYLDMPYFVSVLERALTDQLCFAPVSLFSFFSYSTFVMEKGNKLDLKAKLDSIYLSTLVANWSVWFPVQFINFLIMPTKFQVPFSSGVGVLWNCFLSLRNAST
ncbi:unnamed protein product [Kuraishia capsulata CBS 1993]|uniref:Uncharacterized protein n=1 Tax=Kuraishia capsulata CBS 1993 TaxID=1382522 RepID=W6MV15_9ASCO|nr:uncharacterized protein KUCA_T00005710001 [Kuraishia capsulata CBS 1993]CDK29717.1 unnamed protein product [Kuraishia capsulata CBS 1993]